MSLALPRPPRTAAPESRRLRPAREEDLPRIVELYETLFGVAGRGARRDVSGHLADVFFRHPWRDEGLASLVYENGDGSVVGVLGILPRRMSMKGAPLLAAVTHTFMVEPGERTGAAAMTLLKALFSGPQDLTLAEGNDASRRLWQAVGGATSVTHSIRWTHLLRPARFLLSRLETRGLPAASRPVLHPLCAAADLVAGRVSDGGGRRRSGRLRDVELDPASHLACLDRFTRGYSLRPRYDARELSWLVASLGRRAAPRELRKKLLLDGKEVAGWYLYYASRRGVGEVIQLGAAPGRKGEVLDHLLRDARDRGALAVAGQLEIAWMEALAERRCLFHRSLDGPWWLVHSRDPQIRLAIHQGDAFVSRLEGEWWIAA